MRQVDEICAEVGVEIIPVHINPGPGQTTARKALKSILHNHGEGHLIQVLRTLVETENRSARMDAFALYAISDIIVGYPSWADSGLRWFEVFDRVDIAAGQRQAKLNRDVVPQRYGVAAAIFPTLHSEFVPPAPLKPDRTALAAAARAALAAARLAHVERRLELGRQLADLRDNTPSNTKFGYVIRHQFDLHDPAEVAEMIRVWKLYSDRPDVTGKVRNWGVLVALSSPSLPEPVRRQFETKILAGENVTAKSIADKAGARKTGRPSRGRCQTTLDATALDAFAMATATPATAG